MYCDTIDPPHCPPLVFALLDYIGRFAFLIFCIFLFIFCFTFFYCIIRCLPVAWNTVANFADKLMMSALPHVVMQYFAVNVRLVFFVATRLQFFCNSAFA